jgi:Peptidase_C39 like family
MFTGIPRATRAAGLAVLVFASAIGLAPGARADGQMYGDPQAAAPYWRYQHQQDCGLMAVADVIGQLNGREPSQIGMELRGIFTKSESHRGDVYHFDGTSPQDMVLLLQKHGIASNLTTGNSMGTLEQDLAGGHKVIAALNAETIWNYPAGNGDRTTPDHAVVVTGVDTGANVVHVNDSGTPDGRNEQIPMATFSQAWRTSDDLLIVTQETGS